MPQNLLLIHCDHICCRARVIRDQSGVRLVLRTRATVQNNEKGSCLKKSTLLPIGLRRWKNDGPRLVQREGFEYSLLEDCQNAYRFTAVAAADRVESIFTRFSRFLGEEAFFILEYYPDESLLLRPSGATERPVPAVYYSPYLPTEVIINAVLPYLERLVHDGFVGFGLANNRKGLEFFYSEEKVLTFFTDNHLRISTFFQQLGIPHRERLILPQDFGHDHLSLLSLPREQLLPSLAQFSADDLDAVIFCEELTDILNMYEVEEGLSFFLTRKEQEEIAQLVKQKLADHEFADAEFGGLLLDWSDFVTECEHSFDGDLWEYKQGLKIRDTIQLVIELAPPALAEKISQIVYEPDLTFKNILTDNRKRLDAPCEARLKNERFWYQGVVRNQGCDLRRDLIRYGWFKR